MAARRALIVVAALPVALALAFAFSQSRQSVVEHRDRAFGCAVWRGDIAGMRLWRLLGSDPARVVPGMGPPVVIAGWSGRVEAIGWLLDRGADANQRDRFGWTALIAAAGENHAGAVMYLLSRGADINLCGGDGSALHLARTRHHAELARLFESLGARELFGHEPGCVGF